MEINIVINSLTASIRNVYF